MHYVLLFGMLFLMGCESANNLPRGSSDLPPLEQWITFDLPEAPYTVLFPQQPKRKDRTEAGVQFVLHQNMVNPDLGLLAGHNETALDIDIEDKELVQNVMEKMVSAVELAHKIEVTEQIDSRLQSQYPCREVIGAAKLPDGRPGNIHMRIILTPSTIVQISVVGTTSEMQKRRIKGFLNSVRIKE